MVSYNDGQLLGLDESRRIGGVGRGETLASLVASMAS